MQEPRPIAAAPATLERLFSPAAVAVVGASPGFARYGGRVLQYLLQFGFEGPIWPVNPRYQEIRGLKCYPSLKDLPGVPDHVGIAIGHEKVMESLRECADLGVPFVTLFTAGYAELGTAEGRARQDELVAFSRANGIRLLGPNCNGVVNWSKRLALAGTAAVLGREGHSAGRIAVISQSGGGGAVNVMWRAMQAGLRISYHASSGNEADIDLIDLTEFAIEDPETDLVLLFAERISDGAKLARVAGRAADLNKPILIHKQGRSEAGRRAAASHTGAITGADAVHDAAFRQLGLIRVEEPRHLYEAAMMLQRHPPLPAEGIAAVSASGGNAVLAADASERLGVTFPDFAPQTQRDLAGLVPGFISFGNPTDLSPQVIGNADTFRRVLEVLEADPGIGVILPILTLLPHEDVEAVLAVLRTTKKPTALVWTGGCTTPGKPAPESETLRDGVAVYRDIDTALRATATLIRHTAFLRRRALRRRPMPPPGIDRERARALVAGAQGPTLSEHASKAVISAYGCRTTREILVPDAAAAAAASARIGGRVALKIASPDIVHKTELGGVRLDIATPEAAAAAAAEILAGVRAKAPEARLDGILVQEMLPQGLEMIVGSSSDPVYGPVVAVGMGGILVEVLRDTALRLPPVTLEEAEEMLGELRAAELFGAVRGRPPRDRKALADMVLRLSWLVHDLADLIEEVDLNPVVVLEEGQGAVAVDALIVRKAGAARMERNRS